jgi:tRNA modification GTPase
MNPAETIVACASPPGASARAVIRVFGPDADRVLRALTCSSLDARGIRTVRIRLQAGELPALAIIYEKDRSYTGDPGFELLIPGNPFLIERVMSAILIHSEVRLALPGEFTARALLAGRLSLAQAEGVGAMVHAANAAQLQTARHALTGRLGAEFVAWAEELASLLALVEAGIDFTDQEDVVAITPEVLRARLATLKTSVEACLGDRDLAERSKHGVRVALIGRPNAGKSTLFNALIGVRRAVTSATKGSTRDVIDEILPKTGANEIHILDLPGLDSESPGPSALAAQQRALQACREADIALWCDPSGCFDESERPNTQATLIRVRTFADISGASSDHEVCALDGYGIESLRNAIIDAAWGIAGDATAKTGALPRQRRVMLGMIEAVEDAIRAIEGNTRMIARPEVEAESLRRALDGAADLTGKISVEDLLGRIFSTFCVGK